MHVRSMGRQIRIGDKKKQQRKIFTNKQTNKQALANWVKGYAHNMFNVFNKNNDLTSKLARDREIKRKEARTEERKSQRLTQREQKV